MILPFGGSYHWPIQLEASFIGTPRNRPFRFENMWHTHPDFPNNIGKWWAEDMKIQGTKMFLLYKRLKYIKHKLKDWNKNEFGNIFEAKTVDERQLQEINQSMITDGFTEESKGKADHLQQKGEGLCMITKIKDTQGKQLNTHQELEDALVQHFQSIAEEPPMDRAQFINDFTKHIPKLVMREDNFNLNRQVNEEEVSEVIKEMQNGKAPGLDGFNVDFFKACWDIVKQDILDVVEDLRKNKIVLKALNTSFLSLIPKHDNAMTPDRFSPITLCNVVYKIISKIIVNRLKPLLPTLVSEE
eukprot:PITA_19985